MQRHNLVSRGMALINGRMVLMKDATNGRIKECEGGSIIIVLFGVWVDKGGGSNLF